MSEAQPTSRLRQRLAARHREQRSIHGAAEMKRKERERHDALYRAAITSGMTAIPHPSKRGYWLTTSSLWQRTGKDLPRTFTTSTTSCDCSDFKAFGQCPCRAYVIEMESRGNVGSPE